MTRKRFIERFSGAVARVPLAPVPFGIGARHTLFFRLEDAFVLTLVLEFSTRNCGAVTASWYLGATFQWGYVPDKVGHRVYRRVPQLLTLDDRRLLIGHEDVVAEGFDYWWPQLDDPSLTALSEAVLRTEQRFLAQSPKRELLRSDYYKERRDLVARVVRGASVPAPSLDGLKDEGALAPWIAAANNVARTDPRVHGSRQNIRSLAEDAAVSAAVGLIA